jgi:hypothetical protein
VSTMARPLTGNLGRKSKSFYEASIKISLHFENANAKAKETQLLPLNPLPLAFPLPLKPHLHPGGQAKTASVSANHQVVGTGRGL